MAFDNPTRNRLQRLVGECRDLLTREFDADLQELYGIYAGEGRVLDLQKLPHLDDEKLRVATLLRERIEHLASGGGGTPTAIGEAVKRVLREQAFTVLNRFAALRMAEERGIIVESVGGGLNSKGFKTFSEVAYSGLGTAYERYRVFLGCMFDEMAVDLGVLFDRQSPYGLLFPRENELLELFERLNAPEVKPLWKEDETIGWIYQYFNDPAERKKMRDESAAPRNSRELAVRNQFFTPRYVVEFLTDNTLGRIWYEMSGGSTSLRENCRYLVRRPNEIFLKSGETAPVSEPDARPHPDPLPQERGRRSGSSGNSNAVHAATASGFSSRATKDSPSPPSEGGKGRGEVAAAFSQEDLLKQPVFIPHRPIKDPRTILMLDPACGSMHFGLYAFDLFEVIYGEAWDIAKSGSIPPGADISFSDFCTLTSDFSSKEEFLRQVPRLIIEHNLHGIDIDPRAVQIAGLSLWLRAQRAWKEMSIAPSQRPAIKRSNIVCAEPMPGERHLLREFVEQQFPAGERPIFRHFLETIFERMQLAGEAGSLLRIEDEITDAIDEARNAWEELQARPKELFSANELNQTTREPELTGLDAALTTDHRPLTTDFWERAEQRIYDALEAYSEQAENGGGFQRRLFAEDAARGFAFIDVCRKRYDVALMNPPFGLATDRVFEFLQQAYPDNYVDVYATFVARGAGLANAGLVGAITSRSLISAKKLQRWRENQLLDCLNLLIDLGKGVMDDANIESACYTIRPDRNCSPVIFAFDGRQHDEAVSEMFSAGTLISSGKAFVSSRQFLRSLPGSKLLYFASGRLAELLVHKTRFEPKIGTVRAGLRTFDDFRFLRLRWEVAPDSVSRGKTWELFAKGGEYSNYYIDVHLVVKRHDDGKELAEKNITVNGQTAQSRQGESYYYKAGSQFTGRSQAGFSARAIPAGCVMSSNAPMIFSQSDASPLYLLGWVNSRLIRSLIEMQAMDNDFVPGLVKYLPWLDAPKAIEKHVAKRTLELVQTHRRFSAFDEVDPHFIFWDESSQRGGLADRFSKSKEAIASLTPIVAEHQAFISSEIDRAYDFDSSELGLEVLGKDVVSDVTLARLSLEDIAENAVSHALGCALGCAFGRWDIRYATGEQAAPELPDPFAPLPVCPPGQLQNASGLPLTREDQGRLKAEGGGRYPIEIPWDGILVDDPNHPLDIERRVREVIAVIWDERSGQSSVVSGQQEKDTGHRPPATDHSASAEVIEAEACQILGVRSLRDYFRKPAGFFADHLKRYSKSRRQTPIYWPLSTTSGSYTLWIYYHRLTDQTLFQCVNDFVKPKITEVDGDLARLQKSEGGDQRTARQETERLTTLRAELVDFRDELLRVAQLPYKPNLNDGVLITAGPLWKLFRLPKWQKDLKACWQKLEKGDYDWAHLAYTLWPDRVKNVCKTDRSIAIANGLEHLCEVEPPKKKAGKRKKKVEESPALDFEEGAE